MPNAMRRARAIARDQRGLTTVEYVIVLCLIAAAAVTAWKEFGGKVQGWLRDSESRIDAEIGAGGFSE